MRLRLIAGLVGLLLMWIPATAQIAMVADTGLFAEEYRYYDSPINPDLYLIRPGEKLTITFIGTKLPSLGLTVGSEGRIIDRNLGIFDLAGKTLTEARTALYEPLSKLYNADAIDISVGDPYRVSVAVTGAVQSPGVYQGYTSQFVSEIIEKAGGVRAGGSTRRVILSGGPQELTVDLDRVRFMGDNQSNYCLYAGNRIFVPEKSKDVVNVVGEVNTPREIELLPGDIIQTAIDLAGGVVRPGAEASVFLMNSGNTTATPADQVKAGDIVVVPISGDSGDEENIIILGAVAKPGRYTWSGEVSLGQVVEKAGGLASNANPARTTVFRQPIRSIWGSTSSSRYPITAAVVHTGRFDDLPLQPGDSIFVPATRGFVKVTGQVRNPGFYPFVAGQDAVFYVKGAGGFTSDADQAEVSIFNRVAGVTFISPPDVIINDGDELQINRVIREP